MRLKAELEDSSMEVKKGGSPDWAEVFACLNKLKVDVEEGRELIGWLDKMVDVIKSARAEGRFSAEVYAYLLKYVLCWLLMREKSVSDRAYVLGVWHSSLLLKVLVSGLGLRGVNEVLEVLEKGLRRIYEEQGEEVLERLVWLMFREAGEQLNRMYVLGVN